MNILKLQNGKQFNYSNAYYQDHSETLEFTLSQDYTFEEVYNVFSENGTEFNVDNIGVITLTNKDDNVLGVWKGFTNLNSIKLEENTDYDQLGNKQTNRNVKITLKKETASTTYMREANTRITQLESENETVKLENEQLKNSMADLWEVVLLGGVE